ncbi:kinesin-like protein KIF6 isoform X1 [Callorhinchus milii]|uniref:kinesin-like protein KIF6 isoform X1 n=1 Tax=Callorhinchus milii TaxID=7868 RepID=UPI0004572EAD|nr:kinesin-like protein KIF6 isoform X1 [Callorhinchus milii]|eukprot:gi/632983340/ref/XP_007908598.1/ PREDICTED: kinesin-like protein KIF6 isoform X1 [Callorhinchus milii]
MVKHTIKISARLRPTNSPTGTYSIDEEDNGNPLLEFVVPHNSADGYINNKRESYKFKFQKIFDQDAKQEDVFDIIAKPVAESALAGYNGTIFAYGQTGSGKTFTVTGGAERYSDRGIIPRILSYMFEQFQKDSSKIYTTHISYLEIYNECGYDLLDPRHEASKLEDLPKVSIMEDADQNIHLKNLSNHQATNEEESLNLLFLGDTNRMIAETPMNQASTRSHCIFTIHISSRESGSATICRSKLHLVDLAGSERVTKSGVGGQLLTEAKYINLSLSYLEQVIIALAEKNRTHIPYRNSMMTSVLRDSLGGNCMTTMIATISVEKRNMEESISTCRFAQRVALIKNEAVLNEEIDPRLMIIRLKKEIQQLKDELVMITGQQRTDNLSQEEKQKLEELIKVFLEDTDPEATLEVGADMRKIQHSFQRLKQFANELKCSIPSLLLDSGLSSSNLNGGAFREGSAASNTEMKKLTDLLQQRDNEINILVSMLKKEKKKAQDAINKLNMENGELTPPNSALSSGSSQMSRQASEVRFTSTVSNSGPEADPIHKRREGQMSFGRQEAFEIFRTDSADSGTIDDNKLLLKQRFAEAKALGENVNEARNKINQLKAQIEQRQMQRAACGVTSDSANITEPDQVEDKLRKQIDEEKKSYKKMFTRLKGLKTEIEHLQLLLGKAKMKMQKDFEVWWSEEATKLQLQQEQASEAIAQRDWKSPVSPPTSQMNLHNSSASSGHVTEDSVAQGSSRPHTLSLSHLRPSSGLDSSIPLTGDGQTDADILAFVRARQNLMQKKGLGNK